MSKRMFGSLCLTELNEAAKKGHSAFSRSEKNGKIYFNFTEWINDEPDQFGNDASFQLNSKEGKAEEEGKVYFGHAKNGKPKEPKPLDQGTTSDIPENDDLPF